LPNQLDFSPRKKRWLNWQQWKKKNKNRKRPLLLLPNQLDAGKMVHDDKNNDNNKNTNMNTTSHPSPLFFYWSRWWRRKHPTSDSFVRV